MSLSRVATRSRIGLTAVPVHVELHLSPGLPAIAMVGMPESIMREAKERVRSAVISSGFRWPDSRLTINIAPASTPKSGASFDLAIAVAVLIASGQLPDTLANDAEFYGELSLSGDVLPTSGLLAAAWCNRETSTRLFVPSAEAAQMSALAQHVVAVAHLNDLRMPQHLTRRLPANDTI
ncbi:MAG: magnesium chelatase domain-containing protein [Gammaproteobacteria bacterium]